MGYFYSKAAAAGGGMTVTEVLRTAGISNSSTVVTTLASTVNAGTDLVLCVSRYPYTSVTSSSCADSKGNTWSIVDQQAVGDAHMTLLRCRVTTQLVSSDTITITLSGTENSYRARALIAVTGAAGSGQPDVSTKATGTSTSPSAAFTTTVPGVCVGFLDERWTHAYTGSAWTVLGAVHSWGDFDSNYYLYKTTTGASENPAGTLASSANWGIIWVSLKS